MVGEPASADRRRTIIAALDRSAQLPLVSKSAGKKSLSMSNRQFSRPFQLKVNPAI
jgi:hypothetical protein